MKAGILLTIFILFGVHLYGQTTVPIPGLSEAHRSLQMVHVGPGRFLMGNDTAVSPDRFSAWPEHEVILTRPFEISCFEITQAQYEAICGKKANHSKTKEADTPVNKVSWYDCQLFLRKLNKLGLGHFRLPTEAEWEYASFLADSLGINGLDSGVGEWCCDRWQGGCHRGPQVDPENSGGFFHLINPLQNRVIKGIPEDDGLCNPTRRFFEQAVDYHYVIGFRAVRDVDSELED